MKPLITFSIAALILFSGCERPKAQGMEKKPEGPVPVTMEHLKQGDFSAILEATGKTEAFNSVQVYARVSGYLAAQHYKEGSFVSKGSTLFTIDPSDLKNSLASAKASYDLAQATYQNAKSTFERIRPLAQANAASAQDLDSALAAERNAAAALSGAKAALDQAKLNLEYTTIKAPISGFADKRKIDVGTFVNPGANGLLTTMYQNNPIYINFSFSENERLSRQNAIASGKLVSPTNGKYTIELLLSDGSIVDREGTIDFISPFVDPASGNITYRAIVKNSDNKLLPGQFVKVRLKGLVWKNVQYLSQKSVLTGEKGTFVYVIEANNTVTPRPIKTGAWLDGNILIESGLNPNDKIAADNLPKLKPGSDVIVKGQ